MIIKNLISEINHFLVEIHQKAEEWFDKSPELLAYRPKSNGWTIAEILEHIALTSHFLLILIEKGTEKALKNAQSRDLQAELANYEFHREGLDEVGMYQSFDWIRPEHMKPTGIKPLSEVKSELQIQLKNCQNCLAKLPNGEGVLCRTTMSVNQLGKIDVYEYVYFLGKHIERHITQMQRNEVEFLKMANIQ